MIWVYQMLSDIAVVLGAADFKFSALLQNCLTTKLALSKFPTVWCTVFIVCFCSFQFNLSLLQAMERTLGVNWRILCVPSTRSVPSHSRSTSCIRLWKTAVLVKWLHLFMSGWNQCVRNTWWSSFRSSHSILSSALLQNLWWYSCPPYNPIS